MLSCQKEGKSDSGIDKDEEHSLVLAQDLSNSRVPTIRRDCPITRSRIFSAIKTDAFGLPQ